MTTNRNDHVPPATRAPVGLPRYTCDSCRRRPGTWRATFDDGVAFDLCDDCVAVVDDRVSLTRAPLDHTTPSQAGVTQP